ncbi:unnamed protein product [Euphydryas editha]|uniref:Histone-lysine N-methyltransferase SETMAR n=1 Tax=Euphydryas editha TaxID=104508 RepID=A0AAU9TRK6_EUPED|nr:unnamed protein product [Euphydryas editha]
MQWLTTSQLPQQYPKAKFTNKKELQLETIRHPPYSPDLVPTDYHFFRDLDNFLREKKFASQDAVQNAFTQFVESRSPELYRKGINDLPIRWQQCIDNNGNYFD